MAKILPNLTFLEDDASKDSVFPANDHILLLSSQKKSQLWLKSRCHTVSISASFTITSVSF